MDLYVARQPVLDTDKKTVAYELLFRDSFKNAFPNVDGEYATTKVLLNTFFSMGIPDITNNKPAFINFTKELVLNKIPLVFPPKKLVIEILENIEPEPEIIEAVKFFRAKNYKIAMDDFIYEKKFNNLLKFTNIIKLDLLQTPIDSLQTTINKIKKINPDITLLAEKVETYGEFEKAKEMGFQLFQGYFYSKPEIISNKDISSYKISILNIVTESQKEELDMPILVDLIKKDPAISYRLLKFINSAYFQRPFPIDSIKDGVTFMGTDEIKKFINLVAALIIAEDKPKELIKISIIRARMCELIGKKLLKTEFTSDELFTIGMFSLIDAMLNKPMDEILKTMGFSKKFENGLLGKNKTINIIFQMIECCETGNFIKCKNIEKKSKAIYNKLFDFYFDAVKMADSLM
ncbi:MAG: signal transduction protein [Deltaproteobacteria bacterium]|nr:MAG: signal transduction protein [Deltaproteobacteria bacterium]